ncbi:MAG: rRNA (uracil1498-N3)-methyltransferase [Actinomycetota bacterium]|jgi:16S rRNA (uracil1498-N3)-methyltransferase
MTHPWVFVTDVEAPTLDDNDRHHLERVVRVRLGDAVVISDGRGRWRDGVLRADGVVEPTGDVQSTPTPAPSITIAFALTKGERPELAVQKLTELGVDRIVPFAADRSVVRWDEARAESHLARLRRVAREAAMQCRRPWLPVVDEVADFATASQLPGAALADPSGSPPSLEHPTVLVGPEGGWSDDERARGLATVALGTHVLRAETAAITAAALLGAIRATLVVPPG